MEIGSKSPLGIPMKDEGAERFSCPTCKRKFIQDSYNKHIDICMNHKKRVSERTSFNSSKQRLGELLNEVNVSKQTLPPKLYKIKWRQQHSIWMSNRNGLQKKKAAGHSAAALARPNSKGGTLCNGCNRMIYGREATDHIPFCVEKNKRK